MAYGTMILIKTNGEIKEYDFDYDQAVELVGGETTRIGLPIIHGMIAVCDTCESNGVRKVLDINPIATKLEGYGTVFGDIVLMMGIDDDGYNEGFGLARLIEIRNILDAMI